MNRPNEREHWRMKTFAKRSRPVRNRLYKRAPEPREHGYSGNLCGCHAKACWKVPDLLQCKVLKSLFSANWRWDKGVQPGAAAS